MRRPVTMKPEQVAIELQISMRTFYRRVRDGSIPAFKLGTLWRVPKSYVDNFRANMGVDMRPASTLSPRLEDRSNESQTQIPAGRPYTM